MSTTYPTTLDVFIDPLSTDNQQSPKSHAAQHANINDAMAAIQEFIGTITTPGIAIAAIDPTLRSDLAATTGAGLIKALNGQTIEKRLPAAIFQVASVADINAALALVPSGRVVFDSGLIDLVISSTINIPYNLDVVFMGRYTVTAAVGISRVTTNAATQPIMYPLKFHDAHFTCATAGARCIWINIAWQDIRRALVIDDTCSFALTNGSIGVAHGRGFYSLINGYFNMDSTSIAFLADASEVVAANAYPSGPYVPTLGCICRGGTMIGYAMPTAGSPWYAIEGLCLTPDCHSYASQLNLFRINGAYIHAAELVSAATIIDGCFNVVFDPSYIDRAAANIPLLTIKTTIQSCQGISIGVKIWQANLNAGTMLLFTDAGTVASAYITNVNLLGGYFCGAGAVASPVTSGVQFDHALLRNFNADGGQNFQAMTNCYLFTKQIIKNTINSFEFRDVINFASGISTIYTLSNWPNYYNFFDCLFQYLRIEVITPTFIVSGVTEPVDDFRAQFARMQTAPVVTIASQANSVTGVTLSNSENGLGYSNFQVIKASTATPAARSVITAIAYLDATIYVAPR